MAFFCWIEIKGSWYRCAYITNTHIVLLCVCVCCVTSAAVSFYNCRGRRYRRAAKAQNNYGALPQWANIYEFDAGIKARNAHTTNNRSHWIFRCMKNENVPTRKKVSVYFWCKQKGKCSHYRTHGNVLSSNTIITTAATAAASENV